MQSMSHTKSSSERVRKVKFSEPYSEGTYFICCNFKSYFSSLHKFKLTFLMFYRNTQLIQTWWKEILILHQSCFIILMILPRPSMSSLMKYMNELTHELETKISSILPEKFALVFDGWSLDWSSTHYMAACYFFGIYCLTSN